MNGARDKSEVLDYAERFDHATPRLDGASPIAPEWLAPIGHAFAWIAAAVLGVFVFSTMAGWVAMVLARLLS